MPVHNELINDIDCCTLKNDEFALWWLGQHGFVLKINKKILYFDPFLSEHPKRLVPPLLNPSKIMNADFIFGSHDHTDHIDHDAWKQISSLNRKTIFVVPELLRNSLLDELDIEPARLMGIDDNYSVNNDGIRITGIAAAHEFLDQDKTTKHYPYLGYIINANGLSIYHSGDTCMYEGLQQKLSQRDFDVVFVPINGRDAVRLRSGCIGNMTYQEAADLCGVLKPGLIIPGHYGMFESNTVDPKLFSEYVKVKYPNLKLCICIPGNRYTFSRREK